MAISGAGVVFLGLGWAFRNSPPPPPRHKPEKQGPQTKRVGIGRSLGKGLGGNNRMQSWERERETFLPVRIGSSGWGRGVTAEGRGEAGSKD